MIERSTVSGNEPSESMLVIGTVGRNGSGKDAVVQYLERAHGVPTLSIGDVVRDTAEKRNLPATRDNLHRISEELMAEEGPGVFVRRLIDRIEEKGWRTVAVSGIRTPDDVDIFRRRFGESFLLVHVNVGDPHLRYLRLQRRDEARDPQTFDDFVAQDASEEEQFRLSETIARADVKIPNDGSKEQLDRLIEARIVPYLRV
jgi:dephospho-CoA kinase